MAVKTALLDNAAVLGLDALQRPIWIVDPARAVVLWSNGAAAEAAAEIAALARADWPAPLLESLALDSPTPRLSGRLGLGETALVWRAAPQRWSDGRPVLLVEADLSESKPGPEPAPKPEPLPAPKAVTAPGETGLDALEIMRALASGEPLERLLERIALLIEDRQPGTVCSILILDEDGTHVARSVAPSLPTIYSEALIGVSIGPQTGSCGTAMHRGTRIVSESIPDDPNWHDYRALAASAGLQSSWSEPIRDATGKRVIGCLGMYARVRMRPSAAHFEALETASNYIAVALIAERQRLQRLRTLDRLRTREAAMHAFLDASPGMVFVTDRKGRYTTVNRVFCENYGLERQAVLGRTASEVFGQAIGAVWSAEAARVGPGRDVDTTVAPDPADPARMLSTTRFLVRNGAGLVEGIGAIATDVTAQQKAEHELGVLTERLQLAIEAADLGVIDYDFATGLIKCNTRLAEIYGVPGCADRFVKPEDLTGFVHPEDRARMRARMEDAAAGRLTPLMASFRIQRPDGCIRHLRTSSRILSGPDGQPARAIGVNRDISADVAMAEVLEARTHEAEAANSAKSRFLANMSHEMRTPLNGVLGNALLLARSELDPVQRGQLESIERSARTLLDLIVDLLDIGRIEAGALAVERAPVSLSGLIEAAIDTLRVSAEAKGLALGGQLDPALPALIEGDGRRISQVLINLLGNAVKFTDAGSVRLYAGRGAGETIRFSVCDTGPGVPPGQRELIFGRFVQSEHTLSRRHGGTGLGLAISRELAVLMGGRLSVNAREGGGACFWLELPLVAAEAGEGAPGRAAMAAPSR
ncbi:MAG: ATP-binding protein [Pseudomonadota bacterium]